MHEQKKEKKNESQLHACKFYMHMQTLWFIETHTHTQTHTASLVLTLHHPTSRLCLIFPPFCVHTWPLLDLSSWWVFRASLPFSLSRILPDTPLRLAKRVLPKSFFDLCFLESAFGKLLPFSLPWFMDSDRFACLWRLDCCLKTIKALWTLNCAGC